MRTETGWESLPTLPNRPSLRWWCRGSAWRYQQWVRTVGVVKHCCYSRVVNDSRTWCISSVFAALDTTNTGSFLQNWRLTDNSENQQFFAEFIISVYEKHHKMYDTHVWHNNFVALYEHSCLFFFLFMSQNTADLISFFQPFPPSSWTLWRRKPSWR